MTRADIEEEIRAFLREAQAPTVEKPWNYTSADFTPQIRSALRHLGIAYQAVLPGAAPTAVMAADGSFTTEPGDSEGLLIAYFVAARLLNGDLVQKLMDGELGIIFKTGSDYMDTTQASRSFKEMADYAQLKYDALLVMTLANLDSGTLNVYGLQGMATDAGAQN